MSAVVEFVPTMRPRVPFDIYRATSGTNITTLKEMRRSAEHYLYARANPKTSKPLSLGQAAHVAVLEPERFSKAFAVWARMSDGGNLCPRRGQHWEAFQKEHADRSIITIDENDDALAIQQAIRGNAVAMKYLKSGEPEVTLEWTIRGRKCKGRVDWLATIDNEPTLVGLKTATDCRPFIFGNQAAKLGYHLQWAYYHDGYEFVTGKRPRVLEIVVESKAPHAVVVYIIPDDVIQQGRDEYMLLLEKLEECERKNKWPGPAEFEEVLSLPSWVYQGNDDISELGLEP